MRIGLNLCTLRGQGSMSVGQGVMSGLILVGVGHDFEAWVPENWGVEQIPGVDLHHCRSGIIKKIGAENITIRKAAQKRSIDRLLSLTDTSMIRCPVPHLLMIQQAYLAYHSTEWPQNVGTAFMARMALIHGYFAAGKRYVKAFTVQSEAMKQRLSEKWLIPDKRIIVIPSAVNIDVEKFQATTSVGEEPYICYVATASPHKRYSILPRIMVGLKKRGFKHRCKITVTSRMVPEMVKKALQLGVLDRFEFLGTIHKHKALMLLSGAQAMIMPSVLESFGLTYYEAMALGCPVVAANRDFAREALGEAGLYAPSGMAEEYAERLALILNSEAKRDELSFLGRLRFEKIRLTWEEVAIRYLDILEEL